MNLNTQEGLKIISAELKNFQSLEHKLVEIQGRSIVVIGKNGGSKSALLRAIQSPLNSKIIPQKAIKQGEKSAYVKLKIKGIVPGDSEEKEFEYRIDFDSKNQKGKITVKDEDGNEVRTRGIQKDIIGDVSFDVDEFIRLGMTNSGSKSQAGVREQVEILRQFLSKEEKTTLNALDLEYKERYEQRTDVNKEIKSLEVKLKDFSSFSEEDIKRYAEDRSEELKKAQEEMGNISELAVKYEKAKAYKAQLEKEMGSQELNLKEFPLIKSFKEEMKKSGIDFRIASSELLDIVDEINSYQEELEKTEVAFEKNKEMLEKTNKWLETNEEPKAEELKKKLEELNTHQEKFKEVDQFHKMYKEKEAKEKESEKISKRLKAILEEKKQVFEDSTMPVKGLSFDEDGVYYKGLPFDGDHHPSSHIIAVGVKLAMAMNPNLRCVFIKDGSLFDKNTFAGVLKFIEKEGYQLFIEMVDWNAKDEVSVEYAEEFIK